MYVPPFKKKVKNTANACSWDHTQKMVHWLVSMDQIVWFFFLLIDERDAEPSFCAKQFGTMKESGGGGKQRTKKFGNYGLTEAGNCTQKALGLARTKRGDTLDRPWRKPAWS